MIWHFILHQTKQEFREKAALGGIFLYVVSTIFVCFLCFKHIIDPTTWTALFWIILLFASINGVSKSFVQDSKGLQLYYYTLLSPSALIIARIIYNFALLVVLCCICFCFFSLFLGNDLVNNALFLLTLLLGVNGIASILTLISAIASKTQGNFGLMAILSLPLLMPLLITSIKLSNYAYQGIAMAVCYKYLVVLVGLDVIVFTLSLLLFPYLWKE